MNIIRVGSSISKAKRVAVQGIGNTVARGRKSVIGGDIYLPKNINGRQIMMQYSNYMKSAQAGKSSSQANRA